MCPSVQVLDTFSKITPRHVELTSVLPPVTSQLNPILFSEIHESHDQLNRTRIVTLMDISTSPK